MFLALEAFSKHNIDKLPADATFERTATMAASALVSYLNSSSDSTSTRSAPAEAYAQSSVPRRVTIEDIERILDRLISARPDLAEPGLAQRAGFPGHATKLFGDDRKVFTKTLWEYLDDIGFAEVSRVVANIERDILPPSSPHMHAIRFPAHFSALEQKDSPFHQLALGVLGSPGVQFSAAGTRLAALSGLAPVVRLWRVAQEQREKKNTDSKEKREDDGELVNAVALLSGFDRSDPPPILNFIFCV
jgi:hypothetical protein